jgi:hypothetical protein
MTGAKKFTMLEDAAIEKIVKEIEKKREEENQQKQPQPK